MEYIVEKIGMSRTITVPSKPVTLLRVLDTKVCEVNEGTAIVAYNSGKKMNKSIEGQQKKYSLSAEFNRLATMEVANTEAGDLDLTPLAEAKVLLDVRQSLMSPKNNTNLLGCIADAITGNYLLSETELSKADASQVLFESGINSSFTKKIISGHEIFSEALPNVTFSTKTKACLGEDCEDYKNCTKEKCQYNAYLSIQDGKFLSGVIDKNTFGVEDGLLVKELDRIVGRKEAIDTIRKVFSLGTTYLSRNGFTISLGDFNVNDKVKGETKRIIKEAEEKANKIAESYFNDTLESIPGKTREESREIKILKNLNEVRTKIGKIVKKEFPKENPVNTMILSGAGGNILNISQISCSVGQQVLWAKRINFGYTGRTLSFFKEKDLSPLAHGFIYSSFMEGLKPHEFFFGAISGRDALMDTALRTPKSGYLYRRLANALQDLKVEYDGTVRDASGNVVQFIYGDDGYDVSMMHKKRKVSPGEAIGIVTAQSFGEPSTQMVLNVFHFAGVQEMQVTLGLPRLIEIFDARKSPSTPMMEIYLEPDYNNEKQARIIAEKIKEVKLKDLASEIRVNFSDKRIEIELDKGAVKRIHSPTSKIEEVLNEKGFNNKLKGNSLVLNLPNEDFKELYKIKEKLKETIISGIKDVKQILVVKRDKNYVILTAGSNLAEVIEIKGISKEKTISNDIHEVAKVFGIEAARETIIREVKKVIESQGLDIDKRHLKLVSDAMVSSGEVKGVTRMGIISQKSSILARASFETPIKQFVNASIKSSKDELASVIENIILNQPVPVGTGLPGLLVKVTGSLAGDKKQEKKKVVKKVKKTKEEIKIAEK